VLGAQVFTATQFVVEEKVLGKYNVPPLQAVGMEGFFGVTIMAVLMPILYVRSCALMEETALVGANAYTTRIHVRSRGAVVPNRSSRRARAWQSAAFSTSSLAS